MSGFTPGPWVVRNGYNVFADAEHVPLTNMAYIAVTGGLSGDGATIERDAANARLIAAAPDLLEACGDWIAWLDSDGWRDDAADYEEKMLAAMRAAIAKATGQ